MGLSGSEGREDQGVVGIRETRIGTHYMEKNLFLAKMCLCLIMHSWKEWTDPAHSLTPGNSEGTERG